MYYNSNKNNNDYYNSYKKELSELEAYRKEEKREQLIKLVLSLITLLLLFMAGFYLYKYFNPTYDLKNSFLQNGKELSENKVSTSIIIKEEELPVSVQVSESNIQLTNNIKNDTHQRNIEEKQEVVTSINKKDIELIVQIILSQMNTKIEKPLEEQLQEVNKKTFVNKNLKEENHYNKVVLSKNKTVEVKNSSLVKLSSSLTDIINEEINSNSNYTQEIKKEVVVRKNEMRIIIVQKGDTLSKIAKKAYGDHTDYPKIFTANPEIIKNPNQIFVGQRLRIPS